ncbi:MAG: lipoate--protein ligase [Eubacteriales bacterium]|nr:lipoate--protein ligase [Eubacteriales bacterium]
MSRKQINYLRLPEPRELSAAFYFGLERAILEDREGTYLFFWQTAPTVMLGKYQELIAEVNLETMQERDITVVRRQSGGGAIYTDEGTVQFSLITPIGDERLAIETFSKPLLQAVQELGIPASFNGRNDLVVGEQKFSGQAEYRHQSKLVHHGSILIDTDLDFLERILKPNPLKLNSKGIASVRQRVTNLYEHRQFSLAELIAAMQAAYEAGGYEFISQDLDEALESRARTISKSLFAPVEALFSLQLPSEIKTSRRFKAGTVELTVTVRKGKIETAKLRGDFFTNGDINTLESALIGLSYDRETVRSVLLNLPEQEIIAGLSNAELSLLIADSKNN